MVLNFGSLIQYIPVVLQALQLSVYLTVISMLAGSIIGLFLYLGKISNIGVVRLVTNVYLEIFRNTPLLVQMYVIYFATPALGINFDAATAAAIAMTLKHGSYMAEIYRGGIEAVPVGLVEAGNAIGLNQRSVFLDVVLVPAVRNVFPSITNQFILLFQASSVASIIGAPELMYGILQVNTLTYSTIEVLILGALMYLAVTGILTALARVIEARAFKWAGASLV